MADHLSSRKHKVLSTHSRVVKLAQPSNHKNPFRKPEHSQCTNLLHEQSFSYILNPNLSDRQTASTPKIGLDGTDSQRDSFDSVQDPKLLRKTEELAEVQRQNHM